MIQFICGTIVGGIVGVAMMCMIQINRSCKHNKEMEK